MKRPLLYGAIAVASIVVLLVSLPFLIPMSAYRGKIEAAGNRATGHTLKIDGPVRLSIFPLLGVQADKVSLSNVPGASSPTLARTDRVVIAVALLPLLGGRIEVSRILLEHPELHLEVDNRGAANWRSIGTVGSGGQSTLALRLADVQIDDAMLTYRNANKGSSYEIDHLNVRLTTASDGAISARGSFMEHGAAIDFDATSAGGGGLDDDQPEPLKLWMSSPTFKISFDGTASTGGNLDGRLDLEASSLRRLLALFDRPISSGSGLERTDLHCRIVAHDEAFELSDMSLNVDQTAVHGHLAINSAGDTPSIAGELNADRLDLNSYLGGAKNSEPPQSGWSTKPIDLAILKSADADLVVTANSLHLRQLRLGWTKLALKIRSGRLSANLNPIALYGGAGSATLSADASGGKPSVMASMTLANAAAARLLGDAIGVERIEGSTNAKLTLMAVGNSASDMMHGLGGSGVVTLENGAIRGVDLGLIARTIQSTLGGGAAGQGVSTRFNTLSGTFTIAGGVLANRDFRLVGPMLNATGQGVVDLGNRTLDFRLKPVAAIAGTSGLGVTMPFRVTGSWSRLYYVPDLTGIVGGVLQNLGSGASSLTSLLGGNGSARQKNQKPKAGVGDSLKNMFGFH